MKKLLLSFIFILVSFNVVNALPFGSYLQTCNRCSVNMYGTLTCRCLNANQYFVWSSLRRANLCQSVENLDGNLACSGGWQPRPRPVLRPLPRGSYLQTCTNCTHLGNVLTCLCQTRNGFNRNTSLVNPIQCRGIQNINGRLVCII